MNYDTKRATAQKKLTERLRSRIKYRGGSLYCDPQGYWYAEVHGQRLGKARDIHEVSRWLDTTLAERESKLTSDLLLYFNEFGQQYEVDGQTIYMSDFYYLMEDGPKWRYNPDRKQIYRYVKGRRQYLLLTYARQYRPEARSVRLIVPGPPYFLEDSNIEIIN